MVFTSGIVDDALALGAVSSQYYSCWLLAAGGGVEPGGVVLGVGVDTLLSPEASAVRLVSLRFLLCGVGVGGPSGPDRCVSGGRLGWVWNL